MISVAEIDPEARVLVYREPFDLVQLSAFVFIWLALGVFTVDLRRQVRGRAKPARSGLGDSPSPRGGT